MREVLGVFTTAGRLFLRHWPALLTLAFLGAAARSGALWAAVAVSDVQGQLALFFLLLAPLGYLLPIIAMLAICRRTLPSLVRAEHLHEEAATEGRELRLVDLAVSVLVPFMVAYETYGLLNFDIERFRNLAAADEWDNIRFGPIDQDYADRLGIYPLQIALLIVVGAFVVRWVLGRFERRTHVLALAYAGAFVELYYVSQLAGQSIIIKQRGSQWLEDRRAVHWVQGWYDAVVDFLGPVAGAFRWLVGTAESVLGSLDEVVVVPIAWLTLGAVVLGYKALSDEPADTEPRRGGLRSLWADVKERWQPLVDGFRLLVTSGLGPMLLLCVFFLVVVRLPTLLLWGMREVIGPLPFGTSFAFGPERQSLGFALSLAVTAPVLAAASDWLIRRRRAARSQEAPTTPAPA